MTSGDIIRFLGKAGSSSWKSGDSEKDVRERLSDLDMVHPTGRTLILGISPSEAKAWKMKFPEVPFTGVTLENEAIENSERVDMHDVSFKEEFDFCYASQILEHSPAPMVALKRIFDSLKPGGEGFLWIPNDMGNQKSKYHYSCFPIPYWEDMLDKSGLKVLDVFERGNSAGYRIKKYG